MPVITSIKQQRAKSRVNVYLDDKYGFGIDLDNFVKLNLKINQELSKTDIAEIIKTAELQKTSDKIINFGLLRPRSEKEYRDWMRRKKIHESMHEDLFNRLNRLELIDDAKFAKWWVEGRNRFRPKSKRVLVQELRIKGIDKNIIDDTLAEVGVDELAHAKRIVKKRYYKWEKLEEMERKQKISTYLAGKGFGWDVIKSVVD